MRFRAWIWDFSSTHSTTAFSGGSRYSPIMSLTLASSSGSVENFNVSLRQGLRQNCRQHRATEASPIPSSAASRRVDQCVTPRRSGGGSSVRAMITASSTVLGRPERGASASAATPPERYRSRQVITVGRETPKPRAMAEVPSPAPLRSTIRARSAAPAVIVGDLVQARSSVRSASETSTASAERSLVHHDTSAAHVEELLTQSTRSSTSDGRSGKGGDHTEHSRSDEGGDHSPAQPQEPYGGEGQYS